MDGDCCVNPLCVNRHKAAVARPGSRPPERMTPCFRFFDGIKGIQLTSKAVLPEIVGFYMDAEHERQGSNTGVSNAKGVRPGGSALAKHARGGRAGPPPEPESSWTKSQSEQLSGSPP